MFSFGERAEKIRDCPWLTAAADVSIVPRA
jgi:hypothetical protein